MKYPVVVTYPIPGPELAAVLRVPAVRSYLKSKGWVEEHSNSPYALIFGGPSPMMAPRSSNSCRRPRRPTTCCAWKT
jgi:hypothetical protein